MTFRSAALLLAFVLAAGPLTAQPLDFGSADDVFETPRSGDLPAQEVRLGVFAGPAYLDAWRSALRAEAYVRQGRAALSLGATLHPAAGGFYGSEADDAYDALRALQYARLEPTATSRLYLRMGPMERLTLGSGTLVRGFSTTSAWDERTVGVEGAAEIGRVAVAGFTDDVRLNGVVGGQIQWRTGRRLGPVDRVRLGVAAVHDLGRGGGLRGDSALTGVEATLGGALFGDATFSVGPFVTAAHYLGGGTGLGGGLAVRADNLGEALRAQARVAVIGTSSQFVSGAVGPFYNLSNGVDRIVVADSYYDADPALTLAGTPRDSLARGVDVVADLRAVVFGRAEVSQYFRRHIGADLASAYGLRLAARLPREARVELAVEQQGFRGLWALLFGTDTEENTLVLDVAVPVGRTHVFVRSRYGYRRVPESDAVGAGRFLIERRFEPLVGLRLIR